MSTDNETLAYLAGLFDGEGGIFILRKERNNRFLYWLEISITNTDVELISWIQSVVGSRISLKPEMFKVNGKPIHRWRASANQAATFLAMIKPWLKTKRERAEIAIAFQGVLGGKDKHAVPTQEHLTILQGYRESLMRLNKRGIA
jgi:hypothetical protein